ncbi:hypothetical protein PRIPAC_73568 [Pristionchus pacificus]|uniref:Uncharacterized protein n=1 Tax=Pristionchus pacificus TaxID=54126 RepID=A0A2A6C8H1_PRIPA|nr:hypothetical protein PRIPAC_73568 [Pristionchus pacificus]|eukprot:PDM74396.1 hypothetical protein PRIPAC_41752 [Pristionchus pacificus]
MVHHNAVLLRLLQMSIVAGVALAALDCNPSEDIKKPDPESPEYYLYCNLEGTFSRKRCQGERIFDADSNACVSPLGEEEAASDDPFSFAHFQAPDDLCGAGIPLTILSAPVVCNPSISSCPDGYVCRMYERSGTSYCCQNTSPTTDNGASCSADQVTYVEPSTGRPRSCVLSSESSCPVGFGCNLVGGTTTRCCGKDFGCPFNSAAFLNPNTGSHVECSPGSVGECQRGFVCVRSAMFNKHICCSAVEPDDSNSPLGETLASMLRAQCPNGEPALASPSTCDADTLCPTGYICTDGKCCPSAGVCPAGQPLGGGMTVCTPDNPCQDGYECTTTGGVQYCCPSRTRVCGLARNSGVECSSARPAVTRYFFDATTGSCRSFQFSQCGGNANNFNSLDECEGFCVDRQCAAGQPYRVGAVNAACAPLAASSCPRQFVCQPPLFGTASICCPSPELTCNEMVSAGTPCFGRSMTIQRFYFNPNTRRCQPFQYYGCNGNGNNFETLDSCNNFCLNAVDSVCGGVSPLYNPNNEVQRCSDEVSCPAGYSCNSQRYCCPSAQTACAAPVSRGNVCAGSPQRSLWHFDATTQKCRQFTYNGCGGSANRFTSLSSCTDTCVKAGALGQCPRGMTAYVDSGDVAPKTCTLNVMGTCPPSASCVRSTTNRAICCQVVTSCPEGRVPYNIPGSTSVVSCNIDGNDCPSGNVCVESSSVSGFFMCCSARTGINSLRPPLGMGKKQAARERTAQVLKDLSPCPPGLESTGEMCNVNEVNSCAAGELCFKDRGYTKGVCCKTTPPKCAEKGFIPRYITRNQVQLCQSDLSPCPAGSRCMTSNVPTVAICCQQYNHPGRPVDRPVMPPPSSSPIKKGVPDLTNPLCKNSEIPFKDNFGKIHTCNFFQNSCPLGYKCEFSNTGQPVCCNDVESIRCPAGSSSFEFGGRPLACPAGSTRCPNGYACVPSLNPRYHLCCSTGASIVPQCTRGVAYLDPVTNQHQGCSPLSPISCPNGFHCMESTQGGHFICCTSGDITASYKGFCPPRQLPHINGNGAPSTCHMTLHPCPTTAPYVCIYSAERQDSFCCAPIDTAVRVSNSITLRSSPGHGIQTNGGFGNVPSTQSPFDVLPVSGCPAGTRPLVDHFRNVVECGIRPCPDGFACVYSPTDSRWQCCSAGSILLKSIAPPPLSPDPSPATETTSPNDPSKPVLECPFGFSLIDEKCIKVLYVGQKGCNSDVQCSTRESNATCDSGYCICPENRPLVHGGKCVSDCPAGFANIAGRCYDPTTVIFMDSVDERANGTIGGFCLDTVIEEKRCSVLNAYCSEKTITCTCKPGFELKMDFKNKNDGGSCLADPSSKFASDKPIPASEALLEPQQEGDLYFVDIGPPPSPSTPELSEGSGVEPTAPKEDAADLDRYLFQSDHMVGVFA